MDAALCTLPPLEEPVESGAPGGMPYLLQVVQALSLARDLPTIQRVVRHAARRLTGCDGATFVLRDGGCCFYADEEAIAPLWKGLRFPLDACVSGWTMLHRQPAVIADIYADPRIPHEAYRPTFVRSLVMVPIRTREPIGAIGNYWAVSHQATSDEVLLLQALADCTSIAMENVQLYESLERRVEERTQALSRAVDEIHRLSLTDELTGLHNRRGFHLLAAQALRQATRLGLDCSVLFLDLDGLKRVNDELGHEAGDAMLVDAATVLRKTFRESDILARLGGDEFCVLAVDSREDDAVDLRLQRAMETFSTQAPYVLSASIGVVHSAAGDADGTLEHLLAEADARMYERKRVKRGSRESTMSMPL